MRTQTLVVLLLLAASAGATEIQMRGGLCTATRTMVHCVAAAPDETGDGVPEIADTWLNYSRGRVRCDRSVVMIRDGETQAIRRLEGVCACRATAGVCDVPEFAIDGVCPLDAKATRECRPGVTCDGVSDGCPE